MAYRTLQIPPETMTMVESIMEIDSSFKSRAEIIKYLVRQEYNRLKQNT